MEYKVVPVTGFKVVDDAKGIVGAFVSVTGVVDSVKDRILPGSYQKTLVARTPKGVWSHDWDKPVSRTLGAEELLPGDDRLPTKTRNGEDWPRDAGALYVETQFNIGGDDNDGTQRARDAYSDVKFFGDEQEWCADEATEILTTRGWLRYDEVTTEDEAYVIDPVTLVARFEQIQAVNVFEAKPRVMRHLRTGNFSSLTTKDHRWLVAKKFPDGDRWTWLTTAQLGTQHAIFRSSRREDAPTETKWSDAFVEVVAWYWNEGWRNATGHSDQGAYIAQSHEANPVHVAAIRSALDAAFPGGWTETVKDSMTTFRLRKTATDAVVMVTDEHKAPTPRFLLDLTSAQLFLLIERCLDGDGHRSKGYVDPEGYDIKGYRRWYQVEESSVRRFEMACALAGVATNTYLPKDYGNRYGRVAHVVTLLSSQVAKPVDTARVASYRTTEARTPAIDAMVEHDGIVWCPTTASGTWMARREGSTYFTGNSIGYNVPPGAAKVNSKTGVRELSYIDLYEYSPVLFGAMSLTATAGVKDAQQAWRTQVEEGKAVEGQVTEAEAPEPATEPVAETFGQDTPIPVTTTADTIYTTDDGAGTAAAAGVEPTPIPTILTAPEPTEEQPKTYVVGLSDDGEKAVAYAIDWAITAVTDAGMDPTTALQEAAEQVKVAMAERGAFTVEVAPDEAKANVLLTGSYEERQEALRKVLRETLADGFDLDDTDDWGYPRYWITTEATFANRVVAAAYDMEDGGVRYFEAGYAWDGQDATIKNPREVRIEATVAAKGAGRAADLRVLRASERAKMAFIMEAAGTTSVPVNEKVTPAAVDEALSDLVPVGQDVETLTEADLLMLERLRLDA